MTAPDRRSRSTTAASQGAQSRASTNSIHSVPVVSVEQQLAQYAQDTAHPQTYPDQQHMIDQFQTEASIMSLQQHQFDPEVHAIPMDVDPHMQPQIQSHDQNGYYQGPATHYGDQAQAIEYGHMQPPQPGRSHSAGGTSNGKNKKKGSATTAANEKHEQELKEMVDRNRGRNLSEVGAEVLRYERTSKCEKSKQLFAMLWLTEACTPAKTSVPRSRVYGTYASRCGDERVQPLNPASFGKLVRVIFPGITTRRLGVRGESKYHYVDLALVDDPEEDRLRLGDAPMRPHSAKSTSVDLGLMPRLVPDTAVLPTDEEVFHSPNHDTGSFPHHADGRIFADTLTPGFLPRGLYTSNSYQQHLSFLPPDDLQDNGVIVLPEIDQYLSPSYDSDAANALSALYRSHCTTLVDCIRYCKEKQLFRLITSFSGTLTVPVQKLFVQPAMAPWIKECDWIMYQNMIHILSTLILDRFPPKVFKFLDTIAKSLPSYITRTFHGHPLHVLEAKLEPATLFCELVSRVLKVNATAHAAENVLQNEQYREAMWRDWAEKINPKRLMESELPSCGHEETYKILMADLLPLLQPVPFMDLSQSETHYRNYIGGHSREGAPESFIDRIGSFVRTIPSRFPNAPPRMIVDCVKNIGTAAMRDMTINGATSFHTWWLVKIFIDEMIQWLASSGGFLAHRPTARNQLSPPLANIATSFGNGIPEGSAGEGSHHHSRYSSIGAEFVPNGMSISTYQTSAAPQHSQVIIQSQTIPATYDQHFRPQTSRKRSATDSGHGERSQSPEKRTRLDPTSQPQFEHHASFGSSNGSVPFTQPASANEVHDMNDDSGIGLGLLDEPFALSKEHTQSQLHLRNSLEENLVSSIANERGR